MGDTGGMRRFACLSLLLLATCSGPQRANETNAATFDANIAVEDPGPPCTVCASETAAQGAEAARLAPILAAGPGDPAGDAGRAAARGDFRLYWMEGGFTPLRVAGPHCRVPPWAPRRLTLPVEDVARDGCLDFGSACLSRTALVPYMRAFDQSLVADPRFPYPDLCRPEDENRPERRGYAGLAADPRVPTDTPSSPGEAARRGTPASLARLLAAPGAAPVDRTDEFGLTPLAWAVIEQRRDIVRMLLAQGADPLAGGAPANSAEVRPLAIALSLPDRTLAAQLMTPAVARRLRPWPCDLVIDAVRGDQIEIARRMLGHGTACADLSRLALVARGRSSQMRRLVDRQRLRRASAAAAR